MKRHDPNAKFVLLFFNSLIASVIDTYFTIGNTNVLSVTKGATTALSRNPT